MNTKGFIPITTIGVLLLILSSNIAIHLAQKNQQEKILNLKIAEFDKLDWKVAFIRSLLKEHLRWAAGFALIEISRNAELYHPHVEDFAEIFTSVYFMKSLEHIKDLLLKNRIKIEISSPPVIEFSDDEFVSVYAHFPAGLFVEAYNVDNSIIVQTTISEIQTLIKARFFLLENLMDNFMKNLDVKITNTFGKMLYTKAWVEAWSEKVVKLDRNFDEMLFRLAWCEVEEEIFGQTDWLDFPESLFLKLIPSVEIRTMEIETMRTIFVGIYRHVNSACQDSEQAIITDNLELLRKAKEHLQLSRLSLREFSERSFACKICTNIQRGLLIRPRGDVPSVVEQLEMGIHKLLAEIEKFEQLILEKTTENIKTILKKLFESGLPREIVVERYVENRKLIGVFKVYLLENSNPSFSSVLNLLNEILLDLERITMPDLKMSFRTHQLSSLVPSEESLYRAFPPKPTKYPFVSVFHKINVKSIEYTREDPAGMLGSDMATPIYLPFLDIVVWWGQWIVSVELENTVEEIFDHPNQIFLQKTFYGYLHSCLSYRWTINKHKFESRVVIFSLEPFRFSRL